MSGGAHGGFSVIGSFHSPQFVPQQFLFFFPAQLFDQTINRNQLTYSAGELKDNPVQVSFSPNCKL